MRSTDRGTRTTVSTYIDSKYKIYFFGENRCNRCNRVTGAVKPLLYIEIYSYISGKQISNRTKVYVTKIARLRIRAQKVFSFIFIFLSIYTKAV